MGSNLGAFINLVDNLYVVIIAVAGLIGVLSFLRGWILLKYAAQLGGMNSMGTRSFYSEAAMHIFVGLMLIYFLSYITSVGEEIFQAKFAWDNEGVDSTGFYGFGSLVIKIIKLFGVFLMLKGIMSLIDNEGGGSMKKFFFSTAFGLLAMYIEVVSAEFGNYTGINPLALLMPGTPVMNF